jgi:TalC/MipB family fructose-6-phosphate aldolase
MKFFMDTANTGEIRKGLEMGLVDGVTTNPSLLAKEKRSPDETLKEILSLVPGPVSLEVLSTEAKGMIEEARRLASLGPNAVVKIPMTEEGMKAVKVLAGEKIRTNVTLIFQPVQALIAAKAGADYVSPFVGRLDDLSSDSLTDFLKLFIPFPIAPPISGSLPAPKMISTITIMTISSGNPKPNITPPPITFTAQMRMNRMPPPVSVSEDVIM